MIPTAASTDELDLEISVAWIALGSARGRFSRCPSAENELMVTEAEDDLNLLLDRRSAVTARRAA
ncbi:hypothetical protein ACI8AF_25860 [Blastococcus sp. SYSU D00669]